MFKAYEKYLEIIDEYLAKFFKEAEEYIYCKEGCSHCCEKGEYPFTKLEFMYLLKSVITKSDMETYGKVQNKVTKLLKDRAKVKDGEKFLYECPFLIDKKCCAYPYRGLICRTHGLAFFIDNSKKLKVPACVDLGLNYSEVYDKKSQMLLTEKFKSCGFKKEPVAYNISLKELMKTELVEALELDFGETKPLIDWFIK